MAWHMGHPLSQGLFTSFYLDRMLWPDPKSLEEARFDRNDQVNLGNGLVHVVLRAYCLAMVKTCDFVHRTIGRQHHYEEEDFVTNLYHRVLLTDFNVTDIMDKVHQALHWVDSAPSLEEVYRSAVKKRLKFREAMLLAVDLDDGIDEKRTDAWKMCLQILPIMQQTGFLSTPVDAAFSAKIQRRLASSVPPRPVVQVSFDDAHSFLRRICTSAHEAFSLLRCDNATSAMNFLCFFSSRSPQPPVYARCLAQSLILHEMTVLDRISVKRFLFDNLEEVTLPGSILVDLANENVEVPQDPRFQINTKMDTLLTRCVDAFFDIFRANCMNRSRMRRMLCHLVIDWDNVQLDAETIDTELRDYTNEQPMIDHEDPDTQIWSFPLSSWAYYHKLRQMEWIVSLGFELDIYGVGELGGMYWYLQHLASTRLHHLERIRGFTARRLTRSSKLSRLHRDAFSRSIAYIEFAQLEASAIQSFAESLSHLYAFLAHTSVLPCFYEQSPYSSASLRYALRMKPFVPLSIPEVPSYTDFVSRAGLPSDHNPLMRDARFSPKWHQRARRLIHDSSETLKDSRKLWDAISKASPSKAQTSQCEEWWRADTKNVLRSCIAMNIAIETATKAFLGSEGGQGVDLKHALKVSMVEHGKGYHAWWIIPKITTIV